MDVTRPRSLLWFFTLPAVALGCGGTGPLVTAVATHTPAEQTVEVASERPVRATTVSEPETQAATSSVAVTAKVARDPATLIFPASSPLTAEDVATCDGRDRVPCLLEKRYGGDTAARDQALALFHDLGIIAGVSGDHMMDGGYRGLVHLVGEPPVGRYRKHLGWVSSALRDIDGFVTAVQARTSEPLTYAPHPRAVLFLRSVGRHTPAAYAGGEVVAYNVEGSINTDAITVRETLFHELFHLSDDEWSEKALGDAHAAILRKCGKETACLRPYAPHDTLVRGGTFYAFQPGNGPAEYGAELAVRYFRETRAALAGKPLPATPFKCGPPENAAAWKALVTTFFGGVDLSPACA